MVRLPFALLIHRDHVGRPVFSLEPKASFATIAANGRDKMEIRPFDPDPGANFICGRPRVQGRTKADRPLRDGYAAELDRDRRFDVALLIIPGWMGTGTSGRVTHAQMHRNGGPKRCPWECHPLWRLVSGSFCKKPLGLMVMVCG